MIPTPTLLPRELVNQPRVASRGRCLISTRCGNPQLNLRARIEFTPDRQLPAQKLGSFAHAAQPVVSGTSVSIQKLRVNTLSIIPDPQTKLPFVVAEFHFDPPRLRVLKGVTHSFARTPLDFVAKDRMEIPR